MGVSKLFKGFEPMTSAMPGSNPSAMPGSNPVESPEFFRFMRQLLKLSSKCEDHIFS